jgi:hypothetical protein
MHRFVFFVLFLVACTTDRRRPPAVDSGPSRADSGTPSDAGPGRDAGPIIRLDAGPGSDAGFDAGGIRFDAGRMDAGGPDAGSRPDAGGRDAAPPDPCSTGYPCDPVRGCAAPGHTCQENLGGTIGGDATDAIIGLAGAIDQPLFGAGYCTTAPVNLGADPPSCDPFDDTTCRACARCASLGEAGGIDRTFCARACTPSVTTDSCPDSVTRGTYTCLMGENFCLDGCTSDDQCRVHRLDSDADGDIEAPAMGVMAVDRLNYLMSAMHRCDAATDRCVHDGRAAAQAGSTCGWDGECEANGDCIYSPAWHDTAGGRGYCTKFGCDVPGNACAGSGKCQSRGFGDGFFLCVDACPVATNTGMTTDPNYRFNAAMGCRAGHRCLWDGASAAGATDGGGCIPGEYNAVRTNNVGAACTDASTCYSPFGAGTCLGVLTGEADTCTVLDCAAPGVPADVCGTDPDGAGPLLPPATCMTIGTDSVCRRTCTRAADCGASPTACMAADVAALLGLGTATAICTPFCFGDTVAEADGQCRPTERCGGGFVAGTALGTCVLR